MRLVLCVLLSLSATWAAYGAPTLGSGKRHLDREDKLHDLQALRFPTLDAGKIHANCFYANRWGHFAIGAPGVAWPQPPAGPCATPAQAVDNQAALGGGRSPHRQCVNHVIAQWGVFRGAAVMMEHSMKRVTTEKLRETRPRTLIDLALANAVQALNAWGHHLVIETEYSLGYHSRYVANELHVPTGAGGEPNWAHGYPLECGNVKTGIHPLWGSADYIVHDERNQDRIVMVVEAKRFEANIRDNSKAESQLVRGMFAAATANYRGQTNVGNMQGVADPRPRAGNGRHVAGVLSDGARCRTGFLCGNKLNDNGVRRIPLASGIQHVRTDEPFDQNLSCFLNGLVYALHGGDC